ncbi:MAG TPA: DUF2254 domain-containing protein [Solirubrobacterales bacterium]|nr:DUF2254 domain-containing protein [Solirubrobacterales bacterium]
MTQARLALERLHNTFWVPPAAGIVLAIALALALPAVDGWVSLPDAVSFSGGPDTARAVLQMIATVAVSVAGISFSVIVVALVLASQQLSPRVMRSFQRDPVNKGALAVFLSTAAFSLVVLGSIEDSRDEVPELSVTLAMVAAAISLAVFVLFLHHIVRSLNASSVIRRIAAGGHQAVDAPYPAEAGEPAGDAEEAEATVREILGRSARREVRAPRAGYLVSVKAADLIALAERCDGFVEQRVAIGDFVLTGGIVGLVWAAEPGVDRLAAGADRAFVLNEERLVDDDVAFPIRQLADVALKGLSPGINDPTTAENAMDSVADTLVRVARQPAPIMLRLSPGGTPRLRAVAPDLDDLVRLGFDQVRRAGASHPSFSARLLELLGEMRELGGERAAASGEIGRQARAIRDEARALVRIPEDADLLTSAYDRVARRQ